jgi:hypothetical protein
MLFVTVPSAWAGDALPGEAATLVWQFNKDADGIRAKAEQEINARSAKFLQDLKALRDSYTKDGKYDEALAVQEYIRRLDPPCPVEPPCPSGPPGRVEVEWHGTWWAAEVLQRAGNRSYIHYTGWDDSWNEWVTPERIRPATAPCASPACAPPPCAPLRLGSRAAGPIRSRL